MPTNLGKIAITPKGDYNSNFVYEKLDLVYYQGNSYVSRITDNSEPLTNINAWQLSASKGEPGQQGDIGEISLLTFEIDENMHLIMQL